MHILDLHLSEGNVKRKLPVEKPPTKTLKVNPEPLINYPNKRPRLELDDGIIVLFFNDEKYLFLQRTLNHPLVITCCTATIAYSLHATNRWSEISIISLKEFYNEWIFTKELNKLNKQVFSDENKMSRS
ncbi:hypothetical protein RIR_jg28238.t1 [Rhizophagus irregularis DAOM 181602=DAOM 197198]|nr:hypothetical protein RIR_jg28238.t1 [Rhizophagus irregularis DAOM 181602=DAOM 197198]